ncbi:hypothetical protein DFJ58DRAFT_747905 [Suillus subalutaceus]|uniref:uncharacterized protein n=1 Tax=Suillus subalutaceus TaxID=48586 RepID=UPI001B85C44C|nr:uncharacterized protein DFJ58DRAFT_747905 [Suillus subalutaceus]KAG1843360.1 hypothetical protein DFJ58DRAFT_747905 [Suillus subalutaceus]
MSSSELQYIVELSGQRLLPVSNLDDHTPISERLQRLRDQAHAWFKFNAYSFQTVISPAFRFPESKYVSGEYLYLWNHSSDLVTISPIPSKLSQQDNRARLAAKRDVLMDPAQNLFVIVYDVNNTTNIYLATLDDGRVHPHAAGPALVLGLPEYLPGYSTRAKLKCYGRHIALRRRYSYINIAGTSTVQWQLQIWDWQHSTTSSSILCGILYEPFFDEAGFNFLGNDRLLVASDDLKLYSFEDMSKTPQLLACFLLPFPMLDILFISSVEHSYSSQPQTQAQYTEDPEHRLLCLRSVTDKRMIFFISTKIFFDVDETTAITPIPWNDWGPAHVRVLKHKNHAFNVHVRGNRVLLVSRMMLEAHEYELRMMDFSPLAVANRRGLGRVVKERTTIVQSGPDSEWH